jgi:small subunit ribosomal protein S9
MANELDFCATGRRKTAVATVRLRPGTGKIVINGRPFDQYFPTLPLQSEMLKPLEVISAMNAYDIHAKATGGGTTSQAGAMKLAISRALVEEDETRRVLLRQNGLLTRDPRMKERKKSGQPGARKRFQFSKR